VKSATTLRAQLLRSQLAVFAVLAATAVAVLVQVRSLASLPPRILADNFRSIQDTEEMERALALLAADATDAAARDRFTRALDDESRNLTEPGEREAAAATLAAYGALVAAPGPDALRATQAAVQRIYLINEEAMLRKDRAATRLAERLKWSILALLGVALLAGLFVATRAADALSRPLRDLASAVANLGERGPYPPLAEGDYEEARILAHEFNALARRLESYERSNLDQILAEKGKLEAFVASMADGVIVVDTDGNVRLANDVARRALEDPAMSDVVRRVAAARPGQLSADVTVGAQIFSLSGAHAADGAGRPVGTVIVLRDVTEIRRGERDRGELVAKLTHELRTPLTSAVMAIGLLAEGPTALSSKQRQIVDILRGDISRLNALSDNLHEMARA
jgi:nitrogen fixation/metabolism regulation signal transduction histidine kinase